MNSTTLQPTDQHLRTPTSNPTKLSTTNYALHPAATARLGDDAEYKLFMISKSTSRRPYLDSCDGNGAVHSRNRLTGRLLILERPSGHFSILPPVNGCAGGSGSLVSDIAAQEGCIVATNAGYFDTTTHHCLGSVVSRGQVLQDGGANASGSVKFGLTHDGHFVVGYFDVAAFNEAAVDMRGKLSEVVTGQGWLVREGMNYVEKSSFDAGSYGLQTTTKSASEFQRTISARTAIGHDREGRLLLLTIQGETWEFGATLSHMAELMLEAKAVNAINLDGGGSATFIVNGTVSITPSDPCAASPNHSVPLGRHTVRCARRVTTVTCVHAAWRPCEAPGCGRHGACTKYGTCSCDIGFGGDHCEYLICPLSNGVECSGSGMCDRATGKCVCSPGATGAACEIFTCVQNCSGHGACVADWNTANLRAATAPHCVCDPGWEMPACAWRRCPFGCQEWNCSFVFQGVISTSDVEESLQPCSGRGFCMSNGECQCSAPYVGSACHRMQCGEPGSSLSNCSGHGVCDGEHGRCICTPPWEGAACNTRVVHVCNGVVATSAIPMWLTHHVFGESVPWEQLILGFATALLLSLACNMYFICCARLRFKRRRVFTSQVAGNNGSFSVLENVAYSGDIAQEIEMN